MKRIRQFLCAAAVFALLLTLLPSARAMYDDETFAGKSWEEVVQGLMDEYGVKPDSVAMGYCNTVTGETHYHRGDAYMVAASMYKVPINMVFTERVAKGELDWDTKISGLTYSTLLEWTIINSDNDAAEKLWNKLGGYQKYRKAICPYMGVDAATVDKMFWKNNYFTAEQMIYCLTLLQENPERFPRLEETMKRAEPNRWFNAHAQEYEIAHKFGYFSEPGHLYINDCAICYTDDPICIVLFTDSVGARATSFMADFCSLMCDYTQYHTAERRAEEAKAAEEAAIAALNAASEQQAPVSAPAVSLLPQDGEQGQLVDVGQIAPSMRQLVLCGLIVLAAVLALISALVTAHRGKIKGVWAVLTVLLTAAALGLSVMAPTISELVNKPEGDPREAVTGFFDALMDEDYDAAYRWLDGYSTLGLENEPENEVSREVFDALRRSYSYKLHGDCTMDKKKATQQVLLQHLDLNALQADLKQATEDALNRKVQLLPRSELYGEDGNYLPEVTSAAYAEAVESLLARAGDYTTVTGLELELVYTADGWRLVMSPALSAALCGTPSSKGGA